MTSCNSVMPWQGTGYLQNTPKNILKSWLPFSLAEGDNYGASQSSQKLTFPLGFLGKSITVVGVISRSYLEPPETSKPLRNCHFLPSISGTTLAQPGLHHPGIEKIRRTTDKYLPDFDR